MSIAIGDYDRNRPLIDVRVKIDGVGAAGWLAAIEAMKMLLDPSFDTAKG